MVTFRVTAQIPPLDVEPLAELMACLHAEWTQLRFDPAGGRLWNPWTTADEQRVEIELRGGRHRAPGAQYRITAPAAGVGESGERPAPSPAVTLLDLRQDDAVRWAATLAAPNGQWSAEVGIEWGHWPKVTIDGRVDVLAVIRAQSGAAPGAGCATGCAGLLVGGKLTGRLIADPRVAADRVAGPALSLHARHRLGKVTGNLALERGSGTTFAATGRLRGRGLLGRILLLVTGRRIRRAVDTRIGETLAELPQNLTQLTAALQQLSSAAAEEGGMPALVHRVLWDPQAADWSP